ncbi:MAG: pentapeptide repeat-containing protein, partial [candidate division Zixibacteria bacterium]|nr:pentapeptide repeat-containing protein [candidate division Zixibacteria bacterium]
KGLNIFKEDISFPKDEDNFEGINFSYAEFYHSKFRDACFGSCYFGFTKIHNCEFINCLFSFSYFYGATLKNVKFIDCDFVESNGFTNCDFSQAQFENCFYSGNILINCKFDASTSINEPIAKARQKDCNLDNRKLAEIFKGVKEAYAVGGAYKKSSNYFFKQMQSVTHYNTGNFFEKIGEYVWEAIAGYGVRPSRVLCVMVGVFLLSFLWFSLKIGLCDGFILTSGAMFTFGANVDYLRILGVADKIVYVATSFFGISLVALFITVLANKWLRER